MLYEVITPHPEGIGAEMAMRKALERAGIGAEAVGYINQHGTGSREGVRLQGKQPWKEHASYNFV